MANSKRNNGLSAANLTGMSIYHDKKNTVYYDIFSKNGYIITNADVRQYLVYSSRYIFMILLGCLVFYVTNDLMISLAVALIGIIVFEFAFRKLFLYNLPEIKDYQRPKKPGYIQETAENESYFKIVLMIVAGILFALMVGSNARAMEYDKPAMIVSYVVSYAALFVAFMNFYALIKKMGRRK